MYSRLKKKKKTIYYNTNYRTEIKLLPINMDYCVIQLDVLKFFLGVRLHGRFLPNFNFFNVNPQIFQRNRKVRLSNCLEKNLTTFLALVLEILDVEIIAKRSF